MNIHLDLGPDSYESLVERGCLARAGEYLDLDRRVLVVTDSGVPAEYARILSEQCREATVLTVAEGEGSKSLARLEELLLSMLRHGFSRRDLVVAVGGNDFETVFCKNPGNFHNFFLILAIYGNQYGAAQRKFGLCTFLRLIESFAIGRSKA